MDQHHHTGVRYEGAEEEHDRLAMGDLAGAAMTVLIADVGGTNTRIALADDGVVHDIARFANDSYSGFTAVLAGYFDGRSMSSPQACRVAVAGPVTPGRARLTNRDWSFDPVEIARALPGGQTPVTLVNDLAALGHSLPTLAASQVSEIRAGAGQGNGQALVLGLGTGVNACPVKKAGRGLAVFDAELGHASLPASVFAALAQTVGPEAERFTSAEHLFAGRGLEHLHKALTGEDRTAAEIVTGAADTVALTGRLLGLYAREIVFQYLPFDGLYLAGSVARGLIENGAGGPMIEAFSIEGPFADLARQVPLRLIIDDGAALNGLAAMTEGR